MVLSQSGQNRAVLRSQGVRHGRRAHLAAFICFTALLAQFLLPIAHTSYLLLQHSSGPTAPDVGPSSLGERIQAAPPRLTSGTEKSSHGSGHNPLSCLICQTLLHSTAFIVPFDLPDSSPLSEIGMFLSAFSDTNISKCTLAGCNPRAPPHFA